MAEQKQHVDMFKKLLLRKNVLSGSRVENIYVPFIGDGDIAAELYRDFNIYGGDNDPERVATARERLTGNIKVADCDRWAFPEIADEFQAADFDAYCQPYLSFIQFWEKANKAQRLALFFTDGHRQTIIRKGIWTKPTGETENLQGINERRKLYNMYFAKFILPWFEDYIRPYRIIKKQFYLRQHMLYWGCVASE